MRPLSLLIVFAATLISCSSFKPNPIDLKKVTEDGKFIYEYDRACWIASDTLLANNPIKEFMQFFIAKKEKNQWKVSFGKLSVDGTKFLNAYDVTVFDDKTTKFEFHRILVEDKDFLYKAAKSIELTMGNYIESMKKTDSLVGIPEHYKGALNYAVQPLIGDTFRIYYMPPQKLTNVFPLGGDGYYDVCTKNFTIVKEKRLHQAILEYDFSKNEDKIEFTYSSAILTKIPTPTDVFHVLTRNKEVYHFIYTEEWVYVIHKDGKIVPITVHDWLTK